MPIVSPVRSIRPRLTEAHNGIATALNHDFRPRPDKSQEGMPRRYVASTGHLDLDRDGIGRISRNAVWRIAGNMSASRCQRSVGLDRRFCLAKFGRGCHSHNQAEDIILAQVW
ncbi:hypothetical protein ACKWRH_06815 [Bradyrhizobium sp. Pa8]|uniref:hypothetical protein n=1 Tax=Bradyrhizobium sp. Pa8 TaxID=3386552 RepID=UPI00403F3D2E